MKPKLVALAAGTLWCTVLPPRCSAQGMPSALTQFLKQAIALRDDEIAAAASGTPVVKVLEPVDRREVAVFGIVRVDVPRAFYVKRATDFPAALRSPTRIRFGVFSDPATLSDVAALSLPHDDVEDLAHCAPGACKVKLSSEALAHLRASIVPGSALPDSIVNAYVRQRVVDYVTAYRARGDSALVVYVDQKSRTAAAQVFAGIVSRSPYMYQYAPSLEAYLRSYPSNRPEGLRETVFWSEDDLPSAKRTIAITHIVVYSPPELGGATLIAAKLLYADHYLDGALDLTAVVDQTASGAGPSPGIFLVAFRRLHFDELPSGGVVNVRAKVTGKLGGWTTTWLRDAKSRSEQAYHP